MNTEPTTLALPSEEGRAKSRSALDAEFRHMADDVDYQRDVHQLLAEFAQSDSLFISWSYGLNP